MTEKDIEGISAQTAELESLCLYFNADSGRYGVEIRHVLQIAGMGEIIEMPNMPPGMKKAALH